MKMMMMTMMITIIIKHHSHKIPSNAATKVTGKLSLQTVNSGKHDISAQAHCDIGIGSRVYDIMKLTAHL